MLELLLCVPPVGDQSVLHPRLIASVRVLRSTSLPQLLMFKVQPTAETTILQTLLQVDLKSREKNESSYCSSQTSRGLQ